MEKINLFENHPIADIQSNVVFANNGNMIVCYEGLLPEIYSLSEKDYEDIHSTWFQALKSLPTRCVIHKQDLYTKRLYSSEKLPQNTFLAEATHQHFKGREYIEHRCYLFFILTRNKTFNNPKYMNPFRKLPKEIHLKMEGQAKSFVNSVCDSVSFINNNRKMTFTPLKSNEILMLSDNYFNGFNEGFDTDILMEKSKVSVGDHYFDVMAINSELCFGESVQSSKTNAQFTSDDFVFHQGFIDGIGLNLN
ncbi:MAG: DUF3875 domain-containing protein, partial [Arenibacter latericius]|nr:DUF3875 domain-containing protein [Arenibacter latericius]